MSLGMFRGKDSSNRIEISSLVQDLLNFGVLGSLQLLGGGRWVGGCLGHVGCPHTCTHACACMYTHVYMYRNCKWLPTWRHPCLSCLTCMCVCVCAHVYVHACMHERPPHTPTPTATSIHPPHPQGRTPRISKNSITLEQIKIFQFHLKI